MLARFGRFFSHSGALLCQSCWDISALAGVQVMLRENVIKDPVGACPATNPPLELELELASLFIFDAGTSSRRHLRPLITSALPPVQSFAQRPSAAQFPSIEIAYLQVNEEIAIRGAGTIVSTFGDR